MAGGASPLDWESLSYGAAVSVLVVILLRELVLYVRVQAQRERDRPPGPRPWPIVGNLLDLAVANPSVHLQHLAVKFGPIMYLRLGSVPCVVVSSADAARDLVRSSDEHISSRPNLMSARILVESKTMAYAPSGKLWSNLRRFCANELLSTKRVASYEGGRREELSNMMQVVLEASNRSEALNMRLWLFQTLANMMTRMLVNKRTYHGNEANSYQEEVQEEFDLWVQGRKRLILVAAIGDYVPWLRFYSEEVQGWRSKLQASAERATALAEKLLELEKRRQRAAEKEDDESYVPDFVDVMIANPIVYDGKVLEERFIIKQIMEFIFAGTETTSTPVEWALAELVAHPELAKRARQEMDGVVGLDSLVHESDIPKLPFLQAIVKETFRLHPPAPLGLPRESTAPIEARGYKIPAGARVLFNIFAIQRDPARYKNPDKFDPDRFLEQHVQVNHMSAFDSYELIPFGVGRRICPAYNLGNLNVHILLGNFIHSYEWFVPNGRMLDMTQMVLPVTISLKNPLTLVPKHRDGVPAF